MIWTDRQVTQLHALWRKCDADGKPLFSREQVAEALGIGLKAVIAKLGREYQNGRLEPRVNNSTNGGRRLGEKELQAAKIAAAKSRAVRLVKPALTPLPATFVSIARPRLCQWPMWSHGDRPPMPPPFCGAAVAVEHSYCVEHCRRAFHNFAALRLVQTNHTQRIGSPF